VTAGAEHRPVAVIGAGPAGLGVAAELARRGIGATVLERSETIGASWRARYPDLRLNTDRRVSGLPGARIPRSAGRWPARDDYVAFLESYAIRNRLDVRFGTEVERVDRAADGWLLRSSAGNLLTRFVIVCTGHDREPRLPAWPGVGEFSGELLHATDFQDAAAFARRAALVVGLGTSGTETAVRLAPRAGKVWLSFRSSPNPMPEHVLGVPITLWARLFEGTPDWLTDRLGRLTVGDMSSHGPPRPGDRAEGEADGPGGRPGLHRRRQGRARSSWFPPSRAST
jgi:putative flavoprotein involved in K+ transport